MRKEIGEIFEYRGVRLRTKKAVVQDSCKGCYLEERNCADLDCWQTYGKSEVIYKMADSLVIEVKTGEEFVVNKVPYKVVEVLGGASCNDCGIYNKTNNDCIFGCNINQMLQPIELIGIYKKIFEVKCPYCLEEWESKQINTEKMTCPYCEETFKVKQVDNSGNLDNLIQKK